MISNEIAINKVVDLIEIYKFGLCYLSIRILLNNSKNLIFQNRGNLKHVDYV
jgi:hypothetical protein